MLFRVPVTRNSTFDAVEAAAAAAYFTAERGLRWGSPNINLEAARQQAEINYLQSCWNSAITQLGPASNPGITAGYNLAGHNVTVPLDSVAKNLATRLRARGVVLPAAYWVIVSGVPTEASEGATYAVGDTFNIGTLGMVSGVGQVLTVTTGDVETFSIINMGLYPATPGTSTVATSGTSGSGDNNLTVSLVVTTIPVLYNF
jgi:hypothetical protein